MRSGYHYIRGGDCSKFQHSSYVGTLLSPHDDIKETPSVVPPENGIKNNMVAIQLPGELGVAHGPAQLQQGYAHSKQHFKGLHCHPKSQSSILDCGFQPLIPGDSACYSQGSRNQISRDENVNHFSSTHVSSYLGNIAKSVYITSYQQKVCSRSVSRDKVLPVGELEPPTDDDIRDYIAERVRYFETISKRVPSEKLCNRDSPLQSGPISPKIDCFSHLPKTCASVPAVGPALEEDSSKGSKAFAVLLPKSKGIDDCSASASEKHSKGTLFPAVENSKHAPKESVEKSSSIYLDLSVKENPWTYIYPHTAITNLFIQMAVDIHFSLVAIIIKVFIADGMKFIYRMA